MNKLYTVAIGDWSGDGHGRHDDFVIQVSEKFTPEILGENFTRNVKRLGFGPHDFCEDYEDSTIPADQVTALREAGFDFDSVDEDHLDLYTDGEVGVSPEGMLHIIMWYFGDGLPDFEWALQNPDRPPALVGYGADTAGRGFIGYGLYFN